MTAASSKSQRLLSLDAFRGLTILGMILVNNPGSWSHMYPPLGHAKWHGWTPTDLIFPFFLFIVGTSLAYSLRKARELGGATPEVYARIIRRTCTLLLLGIGMALYGRVLDYALGNADSLKLDTLRYPGVLQRIALVYFAASLITLKVSVRGQVLLALVLLLGYWGLLTWLPSSGDYASNLSNEGNVVRVVDRAVIGQNHMYAAEPTDPEGLLSTLPAIVTALLGFWTGLFIQRGRTLPVAIRAVPSPGAPTITLRSICLIIAAGAAIAGVGLAWGHLFPINKKLWTSSYVLFTGGLAMIGLAACLALFDRAGFRRLARPFEIVGVNAITVFVGSGLLARTLGAVRVGNTSVQGWIYKNAFTDRLADLRLPMKDLTDQVAGLQPIRLACAFITDSVADPRFASLLFALLTVAFWWLVAAIMARRGWSLRV